MGEIMERMWQWLCYHQFFIHGTIVFISIMMGAIPYMYPQVNYNGLIAGLLLMIIPEVMLISITVVRSSANIDNLIGKNGMKIYIEKKEEVISLEKLINDAKTSIFISGISLKTISDHIDLIKRKSHNISFKLLAADHNNPYLNDLYDNLRGGEDVESQEKTMKLLHEYAKKKNTSIEIRKTSRPTPALFIARDKDNINGLIRVEHLLNSTSNRDNRPYAVIKKTNRAWYNIYNEQIEDTWKKGTDYFDSEQLKGQTEEEPQKPLDT